MSDMSVGQWVGGIVGAVVGALSGGGYNVPGAIQGFAVGAGIGGVVDPPKGPNIKAPPDQQLEFQTSTYGVEKPDLYGSPILSGNIIYFENGKLRRVVTKKKSGGKGGGGGGTTEVVDYYGTWAVALGNARPGAKLRRLWVGNKLFYDAINSDELDDYYSGGAILGNVIQSNKNGSKFTFYDGSQAVPNSRIASVVGSANAESYEGTMYIMFYDVHMGDYGNSLMGAQIRAEIVCLPSIKPKKVSSFTDTAVEDGNFSARPCFLGVYSSGFMKPHWKNTYPGSSSYTAHHSGFFGAFSRISVDVTGGTGVPPMGLNTKGIYPVKNSQITQDPDFQSYITGIEIYQITDNGYVFVKRQSSSLWLVRNESYKGTISDNNFAFCVDGNGDTISFDTTNISRWSEGFVAPSVSVSHGLDVSGKPGNGVGLACAWCADGFIYLGYSAGATSYLSNYAVFNAQSLELVNEFSIPNAISDRGQSAFVVENGILIRGWVDTAGKITLEKWQLGGVGVGAESLSSVVRSIADRAGIKSAELDTSLLSGTVDGFAATGGTRGALGVLQGAFLFDVVEMGYGLKCVPRGLAPVATISYEDLGAGEVGGTVPRLLLEREMDQQLARKLTIKFRDQDREQNEGTAEAPEWPVDSNVEEVVSFPLAMTQGKANKVADILMKARQTERSQITCTLPQKYLGLRPSDNIIINTPDRSYQVRIAARSESLNQAVQIVGRLSAPSLWTSDAIAGDKNYIPDIIDLISDSEVVFVDGPMMLIEQDTYGFLYGMGGVGNWPGGALMRSDDGGQTFSTLSGVAESATIATAVSVLPVDESLVIDYESHLSVILQYGSLSSVTIDQMMAGSNLAAYGADGRWEIIAFANADPAANGQFRLSTLARGMFGTEWATGLHKAGDLIVILGADETPFVTLPAEKLAAVVSYKAVTFGQEIDEANIESFIYRGANLRPYAPILDPYEPVGGGISFSVRSRTRYPSSFWFSGVQPQNEPVIKFEADVMNGSSVVRTIQSSDGNFFYSDAEQMTDFGFTQESVEFRVFQIGDRVGRGYPSVATFESEGFTPVALDVKLWLDDESPITVVSGACSVWGDRSSGWDMTQATAGQRPAVINSALSGRRVLRFNGTTSNMSNASNGARDAFRNVPSGWFFSVVNVATSASKTNPLIWWTVGSGGSSRATLRVNGASASIGARRFDADSYFSHNGAADADGKWVMIMGQIDYVGRSLNLYVDGSFDGETTGAFTASGNSENTRSNAVSLGAYSSLGEVMQGDMAAMLAGAGSLLSTDDIDKLFGWAAHRYGLTGNLPDEHPYKHNRPPA